MRILIRDALRGETNMKKSKEEILARMHELIPHGQWLDLGYARTGYYSWYPDAFPEGQPFISGDIQGFQPMSRHGVAAIKEWLDLCLEIYPPEAEIAHANYRYCGNESCEHCYKQERSRNSSGGRLLTKPRAGFVGLFQIRGAYALFSSTQPEKRLQAIEREWSEPLHFIHRIETNDQAYLRELWEGNFRDFAIQNTNAFFLLSDRALNTFRRCRFQEVDRHKGWQENMGEVDLYDVTQLPRLVAHNQQWDKPSSEKEAFSRFLREKGVRG